ncbi:hypothetical protein QVD99_003185 [Batrachochytrium dendrobatidis]|nr:hypothetical protein O5D80_001651 [Batrachochytrium dendrobatidis]KAK5670505.1 hypothetical protein QVD99_003185 [Batrachochytrium dendrobatidis]
MILHRLAHQHIYKPFIPRTICLKHEIITRPSIHCKRHPFYQHRMLIRTKHNDLDPPVETAESLAAISMLHLGTHYELQSMRTLETLGIQLRRVGGSNDRGIDLRGQWIFPTSTASDSHRTIPVIVQCKAEKKPLGPSKVRELQGTLLGEFDSTIAILVSLSGFTSQAYAAAERAQKICMVEIGLHGGCKSFWIGRKASQLLGGVSVVKSFNGNITVVMPPTL